jgi:GntR family transcriptional regulator/MocR family aminotransferase
LVKLLISLTPDIDKMSKVPAYLQLFAYIKRQIEDGILQENDRLPSIRQLSSYLMVSKNTVETAYQQLLAEGYIQSRERSGLYVLPVEKLVLAGNERAAAAAPALATIGQRDDTGSESLINFEYGDVDLNHFPLKHWKKCLLEALDERSYETYGYGDRQGHAGLRAKIAHYLYQSRGVKCSAGQIFLHAGTQQAVGLLGQLLPLSGRVAMENPGYNGVRSVLINQGHEIVPIPLEADGLEVGQLDQSGAKTVYVTPSHQFPIGIVMPVQKRTRLLQWAYENEGYIIEDDYDSEFRYQGQPIPALKALDTGDRVVYLGTFSKSFLPGVRLNYMVLPESLAQAYRSKFQVYNQSVSPLIQAAVYLFMSKGYFESHIRKMRKLYQTRHKTLIRAIHEYLGSSVGIIGQKSGMHLLLDVYNRSSAELIELAYRHGVIVHSPKIHWLDPAACPDSYIMLGFPHLSEEEIREGLARLKAAWMG